MWFSVTEIGPSLREIVSVCSVNGPGPRLKSNSTVMRRVSIARRTATRKMSSLASRMTSSYNCSADGIPFFVLSFERRRHVTAEHSWCKSWPAVETIELFGLAGDLLCPRFATRKVAMDDRTKTGRPDRDRIKFNEPYELKRWAKELAASKMRVREAVAKVGVMVGDVKKRLAKR